jgi:hypothetical protein
LTGIASSSLRLTSSLVIGDISKALLAVVLTGIIPSACARPERPRNSVSAAERFQMIGEYDDNF